MVFDEFHGDFYEGCDRPQKSQLMIINSWSGSGSQELDVRPPARNYFLIVRAVPNGSSWSFDSQFHAGSRTLDSIALSGLDPDEVTDAKKYCTTGFGRPSLKSLEIQSFGMLWTVDLVAPADGTPLTLDQSKALSGYYSSCPPRPAEELLRVLGRWTSADVGDSGQISFQTSGPFNFLVAQAIPKDPNRPWNFNSLETRGDWRNLGPKLSNQTDGLIDSTALCPSTSTRHRLNIESNGVEWTLWQIGLPG